MRLFLKNGVNMIEYKRVINFSTKIVMYLDFKVKIRLIPLESLAKIYFFYNSTIKTVRQGILTL